MPARGRWNVAAILVVAACARATGAPATTQRAASQPTPPITASAFPIEPTGVAPSDGDNRIPNAATPAGSPVAAPTSCDVIFDTAKGATAATVNNWIATHDNTITKTSVLCLAGTFTTPIHVWDKYAPSLLVLAPEPHHTAQLKLGQVKPADVNPNDYDGGDSGAITIADSRGVEVYGLAITGYTTFGPTYTPAGIYVTVRESESTVVTKVPHESPCFVKGDRVCGDIYLLDNTVSAITNTADRQSGATQSTCGNSGVGAYGIAVLSHGGDPAHALQHVVVEGNTIDNVRTGQSETLTINGDVEDFLVSHNKVYDTDNIGIDAIGWEEGSDQARHGLIADNLVANVDTWGNASYGMWNGNTCTEQPENAAGIYVDGGSYVWIEANTVWNADQGIDLDVETPQKYADHLLVNANSVVDTHGTSLGDPSNGANPAGIPGTSSVAGHDFVALYVDAFGTGSSIEYVYAHDNAVTNESQFYGATNSQTAPAVDIGGNWASVMIWRNIVTGGGSTDALNPLLELDSNPRPGTSNYVDCNAYGGLTNNQANGDFVLPSGNGYTTLPSWLTANGHKYDAHSVVAAKSTCAPSTP